MPGIQRSRLAADAARDSDPICWEPGERTINGLNAIVKRTERDREMRLRGYQLTRYADDWVITCKSAAEARSAVDGARRILKQLGVEVHPQKTRIVHVQEGLQVPGLQNQAREAKDASSREEDFSWLKRR
jgi:Reverse transcriptase (RNA-dependent DNA polymerase)